MPWWGILLSVIPAPQSVTAGPRTVADVPPVVTIAPGIPESYAIVVDTSGVRITAADEAGAFYARKTLEQLPRPLHETTIRDAPRFRWRGLELDVARHFFSASDVKRLIEVMARWKLNTFHWHLTDDQGWRLPVAGHPELGPGYTEDEIRDVVAYAAARHITIVPEIDLPGHTRALLAAHPELSCRGKPLPVPTTYGVFKDVLCIGNPETYALVRDVIAAAEKLFPGPYLHLGGDEVPTERWRTCAKCRGLTQADFLERVMPMVHRKIVVWDEANAPGVTVMRWRGTDARPGEIMSPAAVTYLSDPSIRWQDIAALQVPDDALGVQAAIWTEELSTFEQLEPLIYPRLLALADVAWSKKSTPLGPRLAEARRFMHNYDVEAPIGLEPQRAFIDGGMLTLTRPEMFPDVEIRYSVDGGEPSLPYESPVSFHSTTNFAASNGRVVRGTYVVRPPLAPVPCAPLRYSYFEGGLLKSTGPVMPAVRAQEWSLRVTGTFEAKATDVYRFDLTSDDGSQLFLGGQLLVDNWGDHAARKRSAEIALEAGCHAFELDMYQHAGGYELSLKASRTGESPRPVF